MVKKPSCVSCGSLKRFPHTFTSNRYKSGDKKTIRYKSFNTINAFQAQLIAASPGFKKLSTPLSPELKLFILYSSLDWDFGAAFKTSGTTNRCNFTTYYSL